MTYSRWEGVPAPQFPKEFLNSYPAQCHAGAGPPEPLLLDTSVIQHLDWVWKRLQDQVEWSEEGLQSLEDRYGTALVTELFSLGNLIIRFESQVLAPPWLVSVTSLSELELADRGSKQDLLDGWEYFSGHQNDWSPGAWGSIAPGLLGFSKYYPASRYRRVGGGGSSGVDGLGAGLALGPGRPPPTGRDEPPEGGAVASGGAATTGPPPGREGARPGLPSGFLRVDAGWGSSCLSRLCGLLDAFGEGSAWANPGCLGGAGGFVMRLRAVKPAAHATAKRQAASKRRPRLGASSSAVGAREAPLKTCDPGLMVPFSDAKEPAKEPTPSPKVSAPPGSSPSAPGGGF